MEATDVMDIVSSLTNLDLELATSSAEIASAMSRTSVSAQLAGMDFDELAAAVGTVIDVTQAAPESVGNAMKTLLSRYGNVKAGSFVDMEDGSGEESVNDTEKVLNTIGISIRNSKMEFRDFSDVLDEVAAKWVSLSTVEKNAIATAMAGTRQREVFNTLMENYSTYQDMVETSANSQGAAEEKWKAYTESIGYSIEKLKSAWEEFAMSLESSSVIKWLVDAATFLVENLPLIIQQFTTFMTMINAYKIPVWLKQLGQFLSFSKGRGAYSQYSGLAFAGSNTGMAERMMIRDERWKAQNPTYKKGDLTPVINGGVDNIVAAQHGTTQAINNLASSLGVSQAATASGAAAAAATSTGPGAKKKAPPKGKTTPGVPQNPNAQQRAIGILAYRHSYPSADGGAYGEDWSDRSPRWWANYEKNKDNPDIAEPFKGMPTKEAVKRTKQWKESTKKKSGLITYGFGNKRVFAGENTLIASVDRTRNARDAAQKKMNEERVNAEGRVNTKIQELKTRSSQLYEGADEYEALGMGTLADSYRQQAADLDDEANNIQSNFKEEVKKDSAYTAARQEYGRAKKEHDMSTDRIEHNFRMQRKGRLVHDGIQYKKVGKRDDGSTIFANKQTGEILDPKKYERRQASLENSQATKSARIKTMALTAGVGGVVSGITAAAGQEGSAGDKAIAGATNAITSGLLSAIPGVGPILGSTLGPVLGNLFTDGILKLVHAEEIAREERVKAAKEELEALQTVAGSIESLANSIENRSEWTSEDYKEINQYISDTMAELRTNSELREKFIENAVDANESFSGKTAAQLLELLRSGTDEQAEAISNALNLALGQETSKTTLESQESERYNLNKKISGAGVFIDSYEYSNDNSLRKATEALMEDSGLVSKNFSSDRGGVDKYSIKGDSYEDKLSNYQSLRDMAEQKANEAMEDGDSKMQKAYEDLIDKIEEQMNAMDSAIGKIANLDDAVNETNVENAFNETLASWDSLTIKNSTLEEAIQIMAEKLILSGENVYDATGAVSEEAANRIKAYLREQDRFSSLFGEDEKNLRKLLNQNQKRLDLESSSGFSWEEMYQAFTYSDTTKQEEILSSLNKGREEADKVSLDELRNLVFNLDPSNLKNYAEALGMNVDEVERLKKALGNTTLADLLAAPSETLDTISSMTNIFENILSEGKIAAEDFLTVLEKFPELLNKYDTEGNLISIGSENILSNMFESLYGEGGEFDTLLSYQFYEEFKSNTSIYDAFKEVAQTQFKDGSAEFLDSFDSFTDDALVEISKNEEMWNLYAQYMENLEIDTTQFRELAEALIDFKKQEIETEIENLESMKNSLDSINESRQKELDLIKAKDALENAKKEKKMVYREGIGWTYESDQTAIQEAKDKVDELETDKDQEDLQYQIDQLESQKAFLEAIPTSQELEKQKRVYEEWMNTITSNGEKQKDILEELSSLYSNIGLIGEKVDEWIARDKSSVKSGAYKAADALINGSSTDTGSVAAFQAADKALSKVNKEENPEEYARLSAVRNEALQSLKDTLQNTGIYNFKKYDGSFMSWQEALDSGKLDSTITEDMYNKLTGYYSDYAGLAETDETFSFKVKQLGDKGGQRSDDWLVTVDPNAVATNAMSFTQQNWKKKGAFEETLSILDDATAGSGWYVALREDSYDKDNSRAWEVLDKAPVGALAGFNTNAFGKNKGSHRLGYKTENGWVSVDFRAAQFGSFGLPGGPTLINEVGTEGIVTPQGTLTALPSKTGVVPADLTKNLFALGEVAPNLIRRLDSISANFGGGNQNSSVDDHSTNINNLYATFQAEDNFDFDKFLSDVRGVVNITKHGV